MSGFSVSNLIIMRHNHPVFGYESSFRSVEEDVHEEGMWKRNLAKVAAAIPVLGGMPVGVVHIRLGMRLKQRSETKEESFKAVCFIIRGTGEFVGLGVIALIVDVVKALFDHIILPSVKWICRLAKKAYNKEPIGPNDFPLVPRIIRCGKRCAKPFQEGKAMYQSVRGTA